MVRIWNFLLPETGEHSFRVEHIGKEGQVVSLDGVPLESRAGQTSFSGPQSSLLRLKQQEPGAKSPDGGWILLVNERIVEEAASHGNGLRDLRSLPDGSYTIATDFDAGKVSENACRRFLFLLPGEPNPREVAVAHQECVWQVSLDGKMVDQESHTLRENEGHAKFDVVTEGGGRIPAYLEMTWSNRDMKWSYRLTVGDTTVPAYWTKVGGYVNNVVPPTISSGEGPRELTELRGLPTKPPVPDGDVDGATTQGTEGTEGTENVPRAEDLPQGVSYDREAGAFQANIKDAKANRFVFLGEFPNAEAAHQKYIEALAKYAPEKRLAPPVA